MSAGICVMNRNAVALAADSAATIGQHIAIRNSANKLFSLSRYAPVGVIIYANADLMRIPVEIIIKEYKNQLGQKPYLLLEEYVADFLAYIEKNATLFHFAENEENYVQSLCINLLNGTQTDCQRFLTSEQQRLARELTDEERTTVIQKAIEQTIQFIDNLPVLTGTAFEAYVKSTYQGLIENCISGTFPWIPESSRPALIDKLYSIFDKDFFRNGYVGIAIAGYGCSDIFPKVKHLHVGGVFAGKIRYKIVDEASISENNVSSILPLAQTDVMQTFLFGINDSFIQDMGNVIPQEINDCFSRMDDQLFAESKKDMVKQNVAQMTSKVIQKLADKARQEYMNPILQSVATLPIEELAMLAESMINITSLRRRVAIDNNIGTVGGPIDVAIISKSDGFIWLKRKHYFDAKYNPQYLMTHYGCSRISCNEGDGENV